MSKKSFTGVLNTMLGEVQEPDAPKKKKGSGHHLNDKTEKATGGPGGKPRDPGNLIVRRIS